MIICGFPGVGKTTMAKISNWVDLESTPFKQNWLLYAEVAKHMSDNGYTVMVSTHGEMLGALEEIKAKYTVIVPPLADKAIYRKRYIQRGNDQDFIDNIMNNWDVWLREICGWPTMFKTVVILPRDGYIKTWVEDIRGEQE